MSDSLAVTDRTRLRRRAQRGSHERAAVEAILDEALVCHIAVSAEDGPLVLPTTHVRVGEFLYVHGSSQNQLLSRLTSGPACIVATLLDGLVLAKTAFHHSVNYRSAVLFGTGRLVTDLAEKRRVLAALLDKLVTGRSSACRPPNDAELEATQVVAFPIDEASAKARTGPPLPESGRDADLPFWTGVIPLLQQRGEPQAT
jgi:nitroimidazol reductase NimA-like FMN-containing flavoprotein (pyridoxamine 5'-phosphate oxidase superfamily)